MSNQFENALQQSEEATNTVKKIEEVLAKTRQELREHMKVMNEVSTIKEQTK